MSRTTRVLKSRLVEEKLARATCADCLRVISPANVILFHFDLIRPDPCLKKLLGRDVVCLDCHCKRAKRRGANKIILVY